MDTEISSSADDELNSAEIKFEYIEIKPEIEKADDVDDEIKVKNEELPVAESLVENEISLPSNISGRNNHGESSGGQIFPKHYSKVFLKRENSKIIYNYKCLDCSFESPYRNSIKRHLLIHQNGEDLASLSCNLCDYETSVKSDLRSHIFKHQYSRIGDKFKCNFCEYETIGRNEIRSHLTAHRNQETMGKMACDVCNFRTVHKESLQEHLLLHRKPKRIDTFICIKCGYKTILKGGLNVLHVVHQCTKPVEFRCDRCEFQTLYKKTLMYHLLTHRNPDEIDMLKCSDCNYQTARPHDLRAHVVIHKDPDKVEKFKCDQCNFETIHKRSLRAHGLTHISCPSGPEVLFRCDKCEDAIFYKHERELEEHLAKHSQQKKVIDELVCQQDDFQTVYKNFLQVKPEYS